MFEVIERMAGCDPDPNVSVTPDVSQDIDVTTIVQRIERLEHAVAELSAKSEEKNDGEKTEEKNDGEKTEEVVEESEENEE